MCTPDRDPLHADSKKLPWATMVSWLRHKLPQHVDVEQMVSDGRFVYADSRPVLNNDPCLPHTFVWFHRELRDEVEVPGEMVVVHRDERIVVIDKPPFLSTIPRGHHVQQSVVVLLRHQLGLPELSPIHRLDRVTSGLLMLATEQRWRGPHQVMFEHGRVRKTYRALAPWRADLELPMTVRNHIHKTRGTFRAEVVPGAAVNAETLIEIESRVGDLAVYRLTPGTGRTHQLRVHLDGLGIPILGDPLYPVIRETSIDDFSHPLQLLAAELEFVDPIDGTTRHFVSARRLPLRPEGAGAG